jgi:hypothetical protein
MGRSMNLKICARKISGGRGVGMKFVPAFIRVKNYYTPT